MKIFLIKFGVIFITVIILEYGKVLGAEEPDGFMGMKWGESIEQCKKKELFVKEELVKGNLIKVIGKGSSIGEIGVEVFYFFYKDKLYSVTAKFYGEEDFESLSIALKDKYGKPKLEEPLKNIYNNKIGSRFMWEMPNVIIDFSFNFLKGVGELNYSYKPIMKKQIPEIEDKLKKIRNNL